MLQPARTTAGSRWVSLALTGLQAAGSTPWDGQKYLSRALEQGFLQAPNVADLRFAIMWYNHDVGPRCRNAPDWATRRGARPHGRILLRLRIVPGCVEKERRTRR
jgi:hypothetical protein